MTQGSLDVPEMAADGYGGAVIGLHYMPGGSDPVGDDVHWIQLIRTNDPYDFKGAAVVGDMYYYIDTYPNPSGNPYYDYRGAANASDFIDRPGREYAANTSWQAWTFIATGDLDAQVLNIWDSSVTWGFFDPIAVPEPSTFVVFLIGLLCVALGRLLARRRCIRSRGAATSRLLRLTHASLLGALIACVYWAGEPRAEKRYVSPVPGGCRAPAKSPGESKPMRYVLPPPSDAWAFKDQETGILLFVESDRQHVAAIDEKGKVLWHRNVVADQGIQPIRPDVPPAVVSIGSPYGWMVKSAKRRGRAGPFVAIGFTDKSFGLIEVRSGAYRCMGSD